MRTAECSSSIRGYRELVGIRGEEAAGAGWQMLIHPDDLPGYTEGFYRAIREHTSFRAEARARDTRGEWRWVASYAEPRFSPDGTYLGHVGISPDIDDHKRAEEALRAAREAAEVAALHHEFQHSLIRAIHEGSPDGILAVDREGIIASHNSKFLDIWRMIAPPVRASRPGYAGGALDAPVLQAVCGLVADPGLFLARVQELYGNPDSDDQLAKSN